MGKLLKIFAGLVILLVVGVFIAISMVDVSQYKDDIIAAVEDTTGRDFNIDGELSMAISLVPKIVVEGVSFANADWGSQDNMLSVGRIEVEVALLALLTGNIQVNRLILDAPEIYLETNQDGTGNWVLDMPPSESETGALPGLSIGRMQINNANLTYRDGQTEEVTNLSIPEIGLRGDSFSSPLQLTLNASYNDNPINMNGELGSPESLIDNDNFTIDLAGNISEAEISVKGNIARPADASGIDILLSLAVDSLSDLNSLAGSELPEMGPINFTGTIKDSDGGYAISGMSLQAGPNDLSGDLGINLSGNKPALTANLSSNVIDITSDAEETETDEDANTSDKVFPSDPLPFESLMSANADISLTANTIKTNAAILENSQLGIKLNNGNLSISPLSSNVAGGTLKSSISLDASNGTSGRLSMNIDMKGFQPGLLPDMADQIEGANTDLSLTASGSGASVAAIMAGLDASLLVKTSEGLIKSNAAEAGSSNILMEGFKKLSPGGSDDNGGTQLVCSVAKIDIKDGIAVIDNSVALQTNSINVIGNGMLNFKDETLDLGVEPQAREGLGINVSQLAELVRLKGTFANPSVGTDTKAALKAGLSAGAAIMTVGLSALAQGYTDKSSAIEDPCAVALGLKPATTQTQPSEQQTQEQPAATGSPVDAVKDVAGGVTDKLKGLFGR
jgi:uncharacterized protein involved in outer membrane biogenesis